MQPHMVWHGMAWYGRARKGHATRLHPRADRLGLRVAVRSLGAAEVEQGATRHGAVVGHVVARQHRERADAARAPLNQCGEYEPDRRARHRATRQLGAHELMVDVEAAVDAVAVALFGDRERYDLHRRIGQPLYLQRDASS